MNVKSERGQGVVELAIIALVAGLAVWLILSMAANQRGMQKGAEAIAEGIDDAVSNAQDAEETFGSWKVSSQTLYPNAHSLLMHGDDATRTTNCYNNNGTFKVYQVRKSLEFHMLCRDVDNSVHDIMLERESETSNRFHMRNAFTPKDGVWKNVENWILRKNATPSSMPSDAVIVIDGNVP